MPFLVFTQPAPHRVCRATGVGRQGVTTERGLPLLLPARSFAPGPLTGSTFPAGGRTGWRRMLKGPFAPKVPSALKQRLAKSSKESNTARGWEPSRCCFDLSSSAAKNAGREVRSKRQLSPAAPERAPLGWPAPGKASGSSREENNTDNLI